MKCSPAVGAATDRRLGITHVTLPPSALAAVESADLTATTLVVAGEACSPELVATLVRTAAERGGAVPGLVADDLAAVGADGTLVPLVGRHVRIQTPQVFAASPLLEAYDQAAAAGFEGTDTAACLERFSSLTVAHVAGEEQNFKITYPHDLPIAEELLRRRGTR